MTRDWGSPYASEEFDGPLDPSRWQIYDGAGTDGVGQRRPETIEVRDGLLTITGIEDVGGGMAYWGLPPTTYGRVEVRAKTDPGSGWCSVLLLWPDSQLLSDGEIDFSEIIDPDRQETHLTTHNAAEKRMSTKGVPGDFTQWHDFAVEWAPHGVTYFIDGQVVHETRDPTLIPRRPMHLAIQLDPGPLPGWTPPRDENTPDNVTFSVDWVRFYEL
ncbi:MAG: family 16 glycosylhydrolase [Dehalococcoidia bacterium]